MRFITPKLTADRFPDLTRQPERARIEGRGGEHWRIAPRVFAAHWEEKRS